mmetsp:Transcript_38691/g.28051  ORF Transcript_38691/g.28051 Transcript_38691/m.28051 type:complete len:212 (+) Transcript_38691:929-1564(+)
MINPRLNNSLSDSILESAARKPNFSLKYFLRQRTITCNLVALSYIWLSISFNFYLISFQMKYFPGNLFTNTYAAGIADLLGYLFGGVIYRKCGLRKSLITCYIFSFIGSMLIIFLNDSSWMSTFVLITKFGITSSFCILFLSIVDVFPTLFTATAFGICNFFARIGTIFSPSLAEVDEPIPMATCASMCLLGAIVSFSLRTKPPKKKTTPG